MGAPLNPVPGVLKVELIGSVDNTLTEIWANVLHFRYAGTPPNNVGCIQLANMVMLAWQQHVASLLPSPGSLQTCVVTDLSSPVSGQGRLDAAVPGTRGDDSIPANAAVLVSYPSLLRYKGGHPRNYLFVLGNADLNGAWHWNQAATDEVQTHWQQFLSACMVITTGATQFGSFCFVRYKGKFLPNGGPPHYYLNNPLVGDINPFDTQAHTEIASQRGRVGRRSK